MAGQYLLISEIFPPKIGGSGQWFWDLYTRLDRGKAIVVTDLIEGHENFDSKSGLCVYRVHLSSSSWGVASLTGLRFYLRTIRTILRIMRKHEIESIHCGRTMPEGIVGLMAKIITGKPYLCYVHGEDIEMSRSSREFTLLTGLVIKFADLLICNSQNSARLLDKWSAGRKRKLDTTKVMYPGVDAEYFCPAPKGKKLPIYPGKKVIVTVSRLQPRKGHDIMIQAMPGILERHPEAHYVIVGSGRQYKNLSRLIDELDLSENVTLVGACSDDQKLEWYRRGDIFVLPNRQIGNDVEGFGIVLLEAQACGSPVIAGDSGGTNETMIEGKTGFILDCSSPEVLVSKISDMLDNPESLEIMGINSRALILRKFHWPRIMDSARECFSMIGKLS